MNTIAIVQTTDGNQANLLTLLNITEADSPTSTILVRASQVVDSGTFGFVMDDAQRLADAMGGEVRIITPDEGRPQWAEDFLATARLA